MSKDEPIRQLSGGFRTKRETHNGAQQCCGEREPLWEDTPGKAEKGKCLRDQKVRPEPRS